MPTESITLPNGRKTNRECVELTLDERKAGEDLVRFQHVLEKPFTWTIIHDNRDDTTHHDQGAWK